MQDHDHGHPQRDDVHERSSTLEDDGIRQLNIPSIAVGDDARGARY